MAHSCIGMLEGEQKRGGKGNRMNNCWGKPVEKSWIEDTTVAWTAWYANKLGNIFSIVQSGIPNLCLLIDQIRAK